MWTYREIMSPKMREMEIRMREREQGYITVIVPVYNVEISGQMYGIYSCTDLYEAGDHTGR